MIRNSGFVNLTDNCIRRQAINKVLPKSPPEVGVYNNT